MTTAEVYRQKEASAVIQVAKYIFNVKLGKSKVFLLGDLLEEIKTGKTPIKNEKRYYEDDYIDWYKPNEIGFSKYCKPSKEKLSKYAYEKKQITVYSPNTILINAIGDVGRVSILNKEASSNQQITGIKPFSDKLNIEYCYYYLLANRHLFYKDLFKTTLPIVNQKKIKLLPIVVPSIEEQEFIVNFLNTLEDIDTISYLDINKWGNEYYDIANKFFGLKDNSKSISTELTHQLDLVKQLRQSFLREAMQGKLIVNDELLVVNGGETGAELLAKIKAEKEQLIKEKKIKKQKPLPPVTDNETPFEIPKNWVWCRLGEIANNIHYGFNTSAKPNKSDVRLLRITDIQNNKVNWHSVPGCDYSEKDIKTYLLKENDIVIARTGGTIGKTYIVKGINVKSLFASYLIRVIPNSLLNADFLKLFFESPNYWSQLYEAAWGAGQPNVNATKLNSLIISLPPLSEQKAIVSKLEELMTYCDGLEKSIKNSQKQNEMLLQQVLREALEPKDKVVVV